MDVQYTLQSLHVSPSLLAGHSFGGKVALQYHHMNMQKNMQKTPPLETWILDALPDATSSEGFIDAFLHTLSKISIPIASKKSLMEQLRKVDVPVDIAQWMTTNVKNVHVEKGNGQVDAGNVDNGKGHEGKGHVQNGLEWKFHLDTVLKMYGHFKECNAWPLLAHDNLHFVKAGRNALWTNQHHDLFQQYDKVKVHALPNAGHWVHIDDPNGLLALLAPSLALK